MVSKKYIREVRTFEHLYENSQLFDNVTGLLYQPDIDRLLSIQASPSPTVSDITAITLTADQDTGYSAQIRPALTNPLNTTFDSKFNRLLSLQNANQLLEIRTQANGTLDPATLTQLNITQQFGLNDPQGISVDPTNGTLFILNQTKSGSQIVRVQPDSKGSFAKAAVSRFNLPATVVNPQGIALDPTSGRLQVLSPNQSQLYEVTQTGDIAAIRDLSEVGLNNPQALVFAPSGDQTDAPQAVSLYVADDTLGSGGITELTLVPPKVVPLPSAKTAATFAVTSASVPTFSPTLVRTVQTSQFSPASPDPGGIVYISHTNSLLISDSEVEEMPGLFTGKNLFNVSLSGTLQSTLKTIGFSNEPAGVGYNPANKHLFFADDDKRRILTLNPGADGQYNTSDDTVTSFSVTPFGSVDPEDVSFSSTTGNLFIIDGVNAEVYQVTTSGTLVSQFDTQVFGIIDPEGIAVGDNGNLFIVGNPHASTNTVGEFTSSGSLVRMIDISAANPNKPAGVAFAPSSQNSAERSLYIVDRGVDNNDDPNENDGRMYEFSLGSSTPTPGILSFSAPTFSINEDGTVVTAVQVTRTGGSSGAVGATVSLTNGTATAPADYNNSAIAVNFANGDTVTKTVIIPIINDTAVEGNETVNLSLGSPTNGATIGSQSSAVLTIVDNDVAPTPGILSFSAPTFSINEDGTVVTAVQVTRTGGSSGAVGATVSLANGTATAPADYNNSAIAVDFADGDIVTKTVIIPIVNDTAVEGNETVNLSLGSPTNGATIGSQSSAVLTIVDNDVAPSTSTLYVSTNNSGTIGGVAFADEDILAYNQSTNTWSMYFDGSDVGLSSFNVRDFHVNSDGSILFSLNNPITLPGAGLVDDSDIVKFTPTSTGTNTAGAFSLYFDGSDVGLDTDSEEIDAIAFAPDGRLIISTEGTPAVPGVASAADEDLLAFSATSLGDNTAGTWTMYFDGSDVGLTDSVEDVNGVWVDNTGKLYLTTVGAFNVPGVIGDGSDIFTFTPTSIGGNTSGNYAPSFDGSTAGLTVAIDGVSIVNNDVAPPPAGVLSFSAPTFSVNEDGTVVTSVQVTRTGGSSGAVGATVSLTNGTATAPDDYNNSAIAVDFADGDTVTKTVIIPIVNDTAVEGNETVNLSLGSPTNGVTIGSQSSAVLTIVDNDVAPPPAGVLSFSAPTFSVNEDGTVVTSVQVTRTGGSSGAVGATVSLTNGTATAPDDYNNSAIAVNFADGDSATKTVTIPIVNDTAVEGNETVNLSLGSPTNGATIGSQSSAVLTIVDNDVAPSTSTLYVSTNNSGTIGGVAFADEDILAYNQSTNTWSMYFDGSDVGLSSFNVRDFHVNSDGSILLSLNNPITLPGAGLVDDSDIVKFTPTSTGTNTAGAFSLYFDGSDVGLDTDSEEIDAIAFAPDGRLIISTEATPAVPGVASAADEDLLAFSATSLGDNTVGTWTMYFDGSDVGLTDSVEDVDGVWIDNTGKLYLTTVGAFNVPGVIGDGSDIFTFTPTSIGDNTSGNYAPSFDGSTAGFTVAIDGVSILP